MSQFVDIETSPEAIQEDEELIEAVEAAVEIVTESVYNQIRYEIVTFLEQVQQTMEGIFPFLVDYRQNPELIWPDMEHLAIFLVLYVVTFVFLAPRRTRRGRGGNHKNPDHYLSKRGIRHSRSRSGSFAESFAAWSYDEMDNVGNSLNSVTGARYLAMMQQHEEESDEERFVRVYPSLFAESHYDRLILPPVCRRIEKPKASELRQQKQAAEEAQRRRKKADEKAQQRRTDEADDPVERLQKYYRHFLVLVRSLFTFDYAGAAWTILLWLQGIIRHRRIQSRDRLVKSPQRLTSTGTDDDILSQGDDSSRAEDDDDNDGESDKSGTEEDENDSLDSVNLPQHHSKGQGVDSESSENNTAATATSTAPSTPFATPNAGNRSRNVITTSEINAQTPRVPLLDSLSDKKSMLSPLVEEKKEALSATAGSSTDNVSKTLSPNLSPFLLQPKHSSGRKVKQSAVEEDDDADFEALPENIAKESPAMPDPSTLESPRASGNTVYYSSQQVNGSSTAESSHDRVQVLYDNFALPGTISTPKASGSRQHNDHLRSPPRIEDASKPRSSTWYFFETAHSKESLKQMSLDVPVPDKNGYFVGDEFLPDDRCTPLLVFVNSRSGPQQGHLLITQLKRLLNPIQIWDLANGSPEPILESFLVFTKLRILVCGGDGTVSWIISALDSMDLKQHKWPPIAILPLGTGNDLARIHGWGAGYNNESLIGILEQISDSYISILDRWELTIMTGGSKKRVKATKNFFNYFSVGVDAEAALQVHYLRERRPEWFFSRLVNKAWYGVLSAEESIKGNSVNVRREIVLYADGVRVPLPQDSQGIIILNIDSYAGGVPLWSYGVKHGSNNRVRVRRSQSLSGMRNIHIERSRGLERTDSTDDLSSLTMSDEERFARVTACDRQSSCQDGFLDIVSVRGLVHLGQCKVGIGSAHRLAQCREIKIVIKKKVAVQIDGEPWRQDKCVLHIKRKPEPALMLHRSADDGGIETEMSQLLDWAEERRLIDGQVHTALMKEFSRRIESKTRERRHENNVLQNLKRAIGSTSGISSMGNTSRTPSPGLTSRPYLRESPEVDNFRGRSKSLHNLALANNSFPSIHHDRKNGINF